MNRYITLFLILVNGILLLYLAFHWKGTLDMLEIFQKIKVKQTSDADFHKQQLTKNESSIFVPTKEWQTIQDGQVVPSGLYYRINFKTGTKEAKLLSDEDKKSDRETSLTNVEEIKVHNIDEISDRLKYVGNDDTNDVDANQEKTKYRTYDDLMMLLSDSNLSVKTEIEALLQLMKSYDLNYKGQDLTSDKEQGLIQFLNELENLLHQIDSAKEFAKQDGILKIIVPCLTSTSIQVRIEASRVIAAAAQNNGRVQVVAVSQGVIPLLLRNIDKIDDFQLHKSSVYALSCLIRSFPRAESVLIENNGIPILLSVFDDNSDDSVKLQLNVIAFLSTLVEEKDEAEQMLVEDEANAEEFKQMEEKVRQYSRANLTSILLDNKWCSRLSNYLKVHSFEKSDNETAEANTDEVEKVTEALLSVASYCRDEYLADTGLRTMLLRLKFYYEKLADLEMDEDAYYMNIYVNIKKVYDKVYHK